MQSKSTFSFYKSYLVDLPVGAIPNQFNQLKDPSWILKESEEDLNNEEEQ